MRAIHWWISSAVFLLSAFTTFSQTTLTSGDIAIVAHNNDDADRIVFVALTNISQGTVVKFTDNGWSGTALTTSEGTWTYTFPASVNAGTVVSLLSNTTGVSVSGSMNLSTSGDQILVYQGTSSAPTFIYGFSSRAWVTTAISLTTSRIPPGLSNGTTARDFSSEVDNGYYNVVSNSGNKATVLSSIGNTGNWTRSNSRYSSFPSWTFSLSNFQPEPASQPTNLSFSGVATWQFQTSWTAPSPTPTGYLVLRKKGIIPSETPADGTVYLTGNSVGGSQVAYVGNLTSFTQKGIVSNTTYGYAIYAYNGSGSQINYLQIGALTGQVTTPANNAGTYYSTINPNSAAFVQELQTRVLSPYVKVSYDQFDETNVTNVAFRDTTGGQKVATCVYTGQNYAYTPPFAWTPTTPFSREHTWCVSWMPSGGSTSLNEYADQHHLFPVNQNSANAVRSNHPLGEVNTIVSQTLAGKYGYDLSGNPVYEPRENHKGDAARALLYMALRYHGINGYDWSFENLNTTILPSLGEGEQSVELLIQWHFQDMPDNYEMTRNDYIHSIQQNRNPFIDHPEWVSLIDFNSMSVTAPPQFIADNQNSEYSERTTTRVQNALTLEAWPNPFEDVLFIHLQGTGSAGRLDIVDLAGRQVFSTEVSDADSGAVLELHTDSWQQGYYLLMFTDGLERRTLHIVR